MRALVLVLLLLSFLLTACDGSDDPEVRQRAMERLEGNLEGVTRPVFTMPARFAERVGQLRQRYGRENVVIVVVNGNSDSSALRKRIGEIANEPPSQSTHSRGEEFAMAFGPVSDIDGFARLIDFGTVDSVDQSGRIVFVTADPNYTYTAGGPTLSQDTGG